MANAPPKIPGTGIRLLGTPVSVLDKSDPRNSESQQNKQDIPPGKVNYYGSSYSGVDIKVIVHMYDEIDRTSAIKDEMDNLDAISRFASIAKNNAENIASSRSGIGKPWYEIITDEAYSSDELNAADDVISMITPIMLRQYKTRTTSINRVMDTLIRNVEISKNQLQQVLSNLQDVKNVSSTTFELATLQTISVQSHRDKNAVRALGTSYVKGYTRGPRTIAGSMIFTMFDEHALAALMKAMNHDTAKRYGEMYDTDLSSLMIDQLPPLDLTIVFANEYGAMSRMSLYGVEFINNGMTFSVEDLLTEEVVNWVARDIDEMVRIEDRPFIQGQRGINYNTENRDKDGSSLLVGNRQRYNEFLDKIGVRRRLTNL